MRITTSRILTFHCTRKAPRRPDLQVPAANMPGYLQGQELVPLLEHKNQLHKKETGSSFTVSLHHLTAALHQGLAALWISRILLLGYL